MANPANPQSGPIQDEAQAHARFDAGDFAAARDIYDRLHRAGGAPGLLVNRAYCELMLGEPARAEADFNAALARDPGLAPAWVGLGDIAAQHNRHEDALRCYDGALALDRGLLVARNNRAQSLVALGRLQEAWRDAETRFDLPHAATLYPHRLALPRWDGSPGARVLVHWEQGFGDIIQHLRFLPAAAARAGSLAFECPPPLADLVRRMTGAPALIVAGNTAPEATGFDCQAALLSLPHLLGAPAETLPPTPYLRADVKRAAAWRTAWAGGGGERLTGIAWRASAFDARRSLALPELLETFAAANAATQKRSRLVSLQKDVSEEERGLLSRAGAVDAGSGFNSFDDTAAALFAVNNVVCVDTAIAHLAGALARPTLLLLNEPAAVRWMTQREDSPWYASLRLLRKGSDDDWSPLLARAALLLP